MSNKSKEEKARDDPWIILHVFESEVRIKILRLLMRHEMASLSEIADRLKPDLGRKITLPAVHKHMKLLEENGIVHQESGIYLEEPDARKSIYLLEGKERIAEILERLELNVNFPIMAGMVFSKTAKLARKVPELSRYSREIGDLRSLLERCECDEVYRFLSEDEKKKIRLWKMMTQILEKE